jgi:hypothetical protein
MGLTVGGVFKSVLNTFLEIIEPSFYRKLTINRRKIINTWTGSEDFEISIS